MSRLHLTWLVPICRFLELLYPYLLDSSKGITGWIDDLLDYAKSFVEQFASKLSLSELVKLLVNSLFAQLPKWGATIALKLLTKLIPLPGSFVAWIPTIVTTALWLTDPQTLKDLGGIVDEIKGIIDQVLDSSGAAAQTIG